MVVVAREILGSYPNIRMLANWPGTSSDLSHLSNLLKVKLVIVYPNCGIVGILGISIKWLGVTTICMPWLTLWTWHIGLGHRFGKRSHKLFCSFAAASLLP